MPNKVEAILYFWFKGDVAEQNQRWFQKDAAQDDDMRNRFLPDLEQAIQGNYDDWGNDPRGRLALIILLDQFSRNLYREDAKSFAQDEKATRLALEGIKFAHDQQLSPVQRIFFYMPLMHSEDIKVQRESMHQYSELAKIDARFEANLDFAHKHYVIIDRFGRYPHRNAILGRNSNTAEREFLQRSGSSF